MTAVTSIVFPTFLEDLWIIAIVVELWCQDSSGFSHCGMMKFHRGQAAFSWFQHRESNSSMQLPMLYIILAEIFPSCN